MKIVTSKISILIGKAKHIDSIFELDIHDFENVAHFSLAVWGYGFLLICSDADKIYHAVLSFALFLILVNFLTAPHAALAAISIGILKEIYDIFKPNPTGFNIYDLVADAVGIVLGFLICLMF